MDTGAIEPLDWSIRLLVYQFIRPILLPRGVSSVPVFGGFLVPLRQLA